MSVSIQIDNRMVPKEVALLHSLKQKYIIKMLDYFEENDKFYIVMERPEKYIDLFDYITEKGTVSERSSKYLFHQVLEAVQYCLSMGVVHRDVKDENILIDLISNQVKLIDFGSGTFLQDEVYTEYEGERRGACGGYQLLRLALCYFIHLIFLFFKLLML